MVIFHQHSYESLFCFLSDRAYLVLKGLIGRNIGPCVISLGTCAFFKMTFQLDDALVGALYLFLNGGALLPILAGFLCIGVGSCFGGLLVPAFSARLGDVSCSCCCFCSILLDLQAFLLFMSRLAVRWSFSYAPGWPERV